VSVVTAFTLPDPPPSGTLERFALGGDGTRSPSGVYVIRNVAVTGDGADSGSVSVQMGLDPDYCSMIGYATMSITQATPATEQIRWQFVGARVATMYQLRTVLTFAHGAPHIVDDWLPPAIIIPGEFPGTLSFFADNVGTDLNLFNANIFLYDIRAREITPYDLLVAARGGV